MKINFFISSMLVSLAFIFISCSSTNPTESEPKLENLNITTPSVAPISAPVEIGAEDNLVIKFDADLDAASLEGKIKLSDNTNSITLFFNISVDDKKLIVSPVANLPFENIVRLRLAKGIKSVDGNAVLSEKKNLYYRVEARPNNFKVVSVYPAANATDISIHDSIVFTYSEDISSGSIKVTEIVNSQRSSIGGNTTIDGNKLIYFPRNRFPGNHWSFGATIEAKVFSTISIHDQRPPNYQFEFEVEPIKIFKGLVDKTWITGHTDQQGRIYFGGSVLHRFFATGELDTTIDLSFIGGTKIYDMVIADNGNIYLSSNLTSGNSIVVEFDNDLDYLNHYLIPNDTSPSGLLVVAGNRVYHRGSRTNQPHITDIFNNNSVITARTEVLYDPIENILVVSASASASRQYTAALNLDLELIWEHFFSAPNTPPLMNGLIKNQAGNYYTYGYFINYAVIRLEYTPNGALVDTLNMGSFDVRDVISRPDGTELIIRRDLPSGNKVLYHAGNSWYITMGASGIYFFDSNTLEEIIELRR